MEIVYPGYCKDCGELNADSLCRPATPERGFWRYCMTNNTNTQEMEMMGINTEGRHPSTIHMMTMLNPNPRLKGTQLDIALGFWDMARRLFENLKDGPELTAGLRKLLEAKDCFVRASLDLDLVDYRDR